MIDEIPNYRYEANAVLTPDIIIKADDLGKVIKVKTGDSLDELKQWVEEQFVIEKEFNRGDVLDLKTNDRWRYDRWFREWSHTKG